MRCFLADLRLAVRSVKKTPGVAAAVIASLAIGIGANAAIFSLFDAVLLRPLPFERPEELVRVTADFSKAGLNDVGLSAPELLDYRESTDVFEELSGLYPIDANLTDVERPERVRVLLVDVDYFTLLGVEAELGRVFRPEDYRPGIAQVVVISDGLWRRRFGADPGVIGRTFRIDEDLFSIVGVAPPGLRHAGAIGTELWAPAGWIDSPFPREPIRRAYFLQGALARLKPGVTPSSAEERLKALAAELRRRHPDDYPETLGWTPRVVPLQEDLTSAAEPVLSSLLAAVGLVLLMVSANVASLLLARGAARSREIALRRALGASTGALFRQWLAEAALLTSAGFGLGVLLAAFGIDLLLQAAPGMFPGVTHVAIDGRILAFTAAISVASGLAFGTAPALQAARVSLLRVLKQTGGAGAPRSTMRSALVVLQYSLAVVLMVGTLLLARSVWELLNVQLGFDPGRVLTARLWLPQPNQPEDGPYFRQEQRVQLFQKLLDRGSAIPGVEAFALTSFLPLDGGSPVNGVEIQGRPSEASEAPAALRIFVSERYFDVMRVPLVRGRVFDASDDDRGPAVAVVSESFAERYFPGEDPLGKRVRSSGGFGAERPWRLIVGIVGDIRAEGLEARARPQLYYPLRQRSGLALALLARTEGSLRGLGESLQATVSAADPDLPLYAIRPMEEVVREGVGQRRFAIWLGGAFSFMALALAGIGVYGVTSYSVRRRRREIGIRLALGAQPSRLLRLVLREGMRLFAAGAAVGLFVSVFAARFLRNLLFEVSVWDPTTYVLVALVLSASAITACSLPARRAARMDPSSSLRYE